MTKSRQEGPGNKQTSYIARLDSVWKHAAKRIYQPYPSCSFLSLTVIAQSNPCHHGDVMFSRIRKICFVVFLCAIPALAVSNMTVRWQPVRLVNGAPVFFQVNSPTPLKTLGGTWLDKDLSFSYDPPSRSWYALGGIALKTAPGHYTLHLNGLTKAGHPIEFRRDIHVSRGDYKVVVALSVPKKFTDPDPKQVDQIKHDKSLKDEAFKKTTPGQEWAGAFKAPVDASYSDVFGTQRKFNGAVLSIHQGLDYRVPTGTPVSAVNAGTVLLAQPLFFEGNCVVIDHGQGLLTLYLHLSRLLVKEGDRIERGQEIGVSGATGRATGAHLHLAVRWRGEYLDPATLLTLRLPETASADEPGKQKN